MIETNLNLDELLNWGGQVLEVDENLKTSSVPVNKFLLNLDDEEKAKITPDLDLIVLFFPNSNKIHGVFAKYKDDTENKLYKIFHQSIKVQ